MANEQKPIWYLPGPNFRYVEDVKALAREAGLRIIDANTTTDRSNAAENPPEVTLKPVAAAVRAADYVPTKAELMAAHERLMQMEADLGVERERLHAQAAEQAAERARLADLAEKLAADQVADGGKLTVAQLRDELTARSITFDPAAKKADLQALLDAAK